MLAADIMTSDPVTIHFSTTVGRALATIEELEIRHLPVVDGDEIVGIISDRDLRSLGLSGIEDLETLEAMRGRLTDDVSEIMSTDVLTIDTTTEVGQIVNLMLEYNVGALPVVESGTERRLVGIVSYIDVLRATRDSF